jgi:carbon-monoxide dehydrogenase small subunit
MMRVALTVNGIAVAAEVAPRTHLADFLREELNATGTHIGCEHGICGACTVEIDGEIARSCITFAVCCEGAMIRTIEGFDDDPIMQRLRRAFTEEHALQCGYCTPGMLIAARDLIRRSGRLSRAEIRAAMSGNLCRCTGYVGIISAIARVMAEHDAPAPDRRPAAGAWLGPAPGPVAAATGPPGRGQRGAATVSASAGAGSRLSPARPRRAARATIPVAVGPIDVVDGATRFTESFELAHGREAVWALMADAQRLARCLPGMALDEVGAGGVVKGRFEVRIGPVAARFAGEGRIAQFPEQFRQILTASGGDRGGGSRVSGSLECVLAQVEGRKATRVDVTMRYLLTGPLAQIGRSAIVRDLARRIGEAFAVNLDAELRSEGAPLPASPLGAGGLVLALLADRLRALFAALARWAARAR